jgi:predicted nucleic acid-binding protein
VILVDTSIWVDHLRKGDRIMQRLLDEGRVLSHPLVIGELAMGDLHPRQAILKFLHTLPPATTADHAEALRFVSQHKLYGIGIGYIDAHLIAAVRLTQGATLWTRDKRLAKAAEALAVGSILAP